MSISRANSRCTLDTPPKLLGPASCTTVSFFNDPKPFLDIGFSTACQDFLITELLTAALGSKDRDEVSEKDHGVIIINCERQRCVQQTHKLKIEGYRQSEGMARVLGSAGLLMCCLLDWKRRSCQHRARTIGTTMVRPQVGYLSAGE